jgi:allophanate hydrolase
LPDSPTEFRFGVPGEQHLEYFGAPDAANRFEATIDRLEEMGGTAVEIDFTPFQATAELLYEGPWVAERLSAVRELIETEPDALLPVTRQVIERGTEYSAVDTFEAMYELQRLRRAAGAQLDGIDCLVTPTTGPVYRIEAVRADPIDRNSNLGYYTNYVNLLDMAAVAVPAGMRASGLPFGVTLVGAAGEEAFLSTLAADLSEAGLPSGAPSTA